MQKEEKTDQSQFLAIKSTRFWHTLEINETKKRLQSFEQGLSSSEIKDRFQAFGANQLPHKKPFTFFEIIWSQFKNPLIYILLIAAGISLLISDPIDAAFIFVVLLINSLIGSIQEWKAQKSTLALQKLLKIYATVMREGKIIEIPALELVPGDLVFLESGNRIPADIRLFETNGLFIDESLLTGESYAIEKKAQWIGSENTSLADRANIAHAGTIVTRGRAKGWVVATGNNTAVGQLALTMMEATEGKPPLLERMEQFTKKIAIAVLVAAIFVLLVGVFFRGFSLADMFLVAIALAVAAIPEGLPVAMTVALSVASNRMARRGVIVRRLTAVEGLGSCTLIATDKTGTLTCNELTIKRIETSDSSFEVTGQGFTPNGEVKYLDGQTLNSIPWGLEKIARAAVLCNEASLEREGKDWVHRGDSVDIAFLILGQKLGWNHQDTLKLYPQIKNIPYEPAQQYAASYHQIANKLMIFAKGSPEKIMSMCQFDENSKIEWQKKVENLAENGYRILAMAEGEVDENLPSQIDLNNLNFIGLAAMIDPLREGVAKAVETCHKAGIAVTMITGDHGVTALAIAKNLSLAESNNEVLTGKELSNFSPSALQEAIKKVRVFARVSPQQKLQIVEAAKNTGHFVAVTGDGVNDAPALRVANLGVAMGKSGTDVAREAAELVISDDNFATIVGGIEEGRVAYDNIRKVIYLVISTGAAEIILVLLAVVTSTPIPLLPAQLLWLNLVTNGIQDVALAFEPSEDSVLERKPRPPGESIFNRIMIERTVIAACLIGGVSFGAFKWLLMAGWNETSARNALLLLMVLFENIHIGNCRSETRSALALSPFKSPILLIGALSAFLLHVISMHLPILQRILRTEPIDLKYWPWLIGLALTVFFVMEFHKWTWKKRYRH